MTFIKRHATMLYLLGEEIRDYQVIANIQTERKWNIL